MTKPDRFASFLLEPVRPLLFFIGKGGVGKTSGATATAMTLAQKSPSSQILLFSTDPAHSLYDAFAGSPSPANLTLLEFDPAHVIPAFKLQHENALTAILQRGTFLAKEEIGALLQLAFPGMDEFLALFELQDQVNSGRYQFVVADTAPTGHLLRMLAIPNLIQRWVLALDTLLAKHRYLQGLFSPSPLASDDCDRFLDTLHHRATCIAELLRDPARCQFVPVTMAEPMSLLETADLLTELATHDISVTRLLINRVITDNECETCHSAYSRQQRALRQSTLARSAIQFWAIPQCCEEPKGATRLLALGDSIQPLLPWEDTAGVEEGQQRLPVVLNSGLSLPQVSLVLFAGKGGCGKTTMACATALAFSEKYPEKRVLVISTDPAHSLSDVLQIPVGATVTAVCPGFDALEMDAMAAWDALRQEYVAEIKGLFADNRSGMELVYDRDAVEKLLDLSPPGLDEIMALTEVMERLEGNRYDTLILDTAPTGHLLRLLEMPTQFDAWLKFFFTLLLKFQGFARLPHLSGFLVRMSKSLKRLRRLLADPQGHTLYAVTAPTELARKETGDLMTACDSLGFPVSAVILNRVVSATSGCTLCSALYREQVSPLEEYAMIYPHLDLACVSEGDHPLGLEALRRLGIALYQKENED